MTPKNAFKWWASLHLHFNNPGYEMQKYGINTASNQQRWLKLQESQVYRFGWLAREYVNDTEMVYTCIAAELNNIDIRYADKSEIKESSSVFRGRRNSIRYHLENSYSNFEENEFIDILLQYVAGKCIPEYLLLIDTDLIRLRKTYHDNSLSYIATDVNKLIKYRTFFNPTKYLDILNEHEATADIR